MNIDTFEKSSQERIISAEAQGESETSFAHAEINKLKQKIEKRKVRQHRLKNIFGGLVVVILFLVVIVAYSQYKLYTLSQEEKTTTSETTSQIPKTGEEVVKALSRHILLPPGTPQIAEVQDVARLKEKQAFFKDAENGDVVVVYETTIFIYRPSKDIVVASGDISGVGQIKP